MLITQVSEINNAEPPRQYLIQLKLKNKFKKLIIYSYITYIKLVKAVSNTTYLSYY